MKKKYETMEAYKVEFNANEQVAAAGCQMALKNGKYDEVPGTGSCGYYDGITDKFTTVLGNGCLYVTTGYSLQYA